MRMYTLYHIWIRKWVTFDKNTLWSNAQRMYKWWNAQPMYKWWGVLQGKYLIAFGLMSHNFSVKSFRLTWNLVNIFHRWFDHPRLQMSLSSKYLQALDSPAIFSQNVSILEHLPTNHTPITAILDQQMSSPACQSDTIQIQVIHLRLHQLPHGWVDAVISTERL